MRLAGAGGQGVILAGVILAEAAILSGRNATQSQAYGPESRGGASRSDVVIADGEIGFPKAVGLDVLLALTQKACDEYWRDLRPSGLLVVDAKLVPNPPAGERTCRALPIVDTARSATGSNIGANMVGLGVLAGLTGLVPDGALERAVAARVPPRSREMNLRALAAGRQLATRQGG